MEKRTDEAFLFFKTNGESLDVKNSVSVRKPTILILGGNPTVDPNESIRNINIVKSILGKKYAERNADNFDIYSIMYCKGHVLNDNLSLSYNYDDEDFLRLASKVFMPLVSKGFRKIDTKEAGQNLRKMVVFAHSAGALVMDNTVSSFKELCRYVGYSKREIDYLLGNISFMAYSPYSVVHSPISAIYVTPINDSLSSWMRTYILKNNLDPWSVDFADVEYKKDELNEILKKQDFISYIGKVGNSKFLNITTAPLRKDGGEDHNFLGVLRADDGKFPYSSEAGKNMSELMQVCLRSILKKTKEENNIISNNDFLEVLQDFLKTYNKRQIERRELNKIVKEIKNEVFIRFLKEYIKNSIMKIVEEENKKTKDKDKGIEK